MTATHDKLLYQYCPKVALFSANTVLLARRSGEVDLDGVYSLVGGKVEHSDTTVIAGVLRELAEEIGPSVRGELLTTYSVTAEYTKVDGSRMILPHYYGRYLGGQVRLNEDEYADSFWCPVEDLSRRCDLVPNVPEICQELLRLTPIASSTDFVSFGPTPAS